MKCAFKDYMGVDGPSVACAEVVVSEVTTDGSTWRSACASHTFLAVGQGYHTMRPVKRSVNINDVVRVAHKCRVVFLNDVPWCVVLDPERFQAAVHAAQDHVKNVLKRPTSWETGCLHKMSDCVFITHEEVDLR